MGDTVEERLATIEATLSNVDRTTMEIKQSMEHYVTQQEFAPIKRGFYGLWAAIGLLFTGALGKLLLK